MTISDEELAEIVDGMADGDEESATRLYHLIRHTFMGLKRLRHDEWEDVLNDTFLVILQAIRGGKIEKRAAILGYAKTILDRIASKKIRRLIRERNTVDFDVIATANQRRNSAFAQAIKAKESPYSDYVDAEKVAILTEELARLKSKDREILQRFYLDGETLDEIQVAMNLTDNQFRLHKCRAKQRLEKAVAIRLRHPSARRYLPMAA